MLITLLINEKGVGILSANCSSKSLKFIVFLSILGGVPVFNLPIENFNDSILFASLMEGLSPILPAGYDSLPSLIIPLRKVPVVNTTDLEIIFFELYNMTALILSLFISI